MTVEKTSAPTGRHASLIQVATLTLLWGTNWPLFPLAVREVSVWTFRAVCVLGAGGLVLAWARWSGHDLRIPRRHWGTVLAASVVYLGSWNIASTYAALMIPTGQAAILGFTMPIWAALGGRLFFGDRLRGRSLAAIALSSGGVILLLAKGWSQYASAPAGFAIGLSAGVGWAGGTLILRRWPVPASSAVLTGWQLVVTGLPLSAIALALGRGEWFMPTGTSIAVIGYITFVPMAIGNVAWFSIVGRLPPRIATLSPILVPIVAMVTGAVVRQEPLGPVECIAMVCCALGLLLGMRR